MARRLDIGIASFSSPEKLKRAIACVKEFSTTDWQLHIVHNPSENDALVLEVIHAAIDSNPGCVSLKYMPENRGYAGAVNQIIGEAETEYIAYLDCDAYVQTLGWDEILCSYLDRFHEIGLMFPYGGAYPIPRGAYTEVMWAPGFCWVLNRVARLDTYDELGCGDFDQSLGHQEEADYCLRLRMAGYKCAAAPEVRVLHDATATTDPASTERIGRGVTAFVNKWTQYFGGKNLNYHSPNVLRWEDWPPNALYLEEYWKGKLPGLNDAPEKVIIDGREYDLLKVPRLRGYYGGRII